MDTLHLEIGHRDDPAEGVVNAVEIYVNGRNLRDLAREVELPFAERVGRSHSAGKYVGLAPREVFSPSRRLLGEPETYYDADDPGGRLALLGCGCGEPGCWPLLARITPRDDVVIWADFKQPHRRHWRYDALGPFVFERGEYEAALRGAPDLRDES